MSEALTVGMAELKVSAGPEKLSVHGLGSCVVLALYDPEAKVAGLAHAMLPTAKGSAGDDEKPGKFCDRAVPALLSQMEAAGAKRARVFARLVGGSTMFSFPSSNKQGPAALGERNLAAAREALQSAGIAIKAEDSGGSQGRSLELTPEDGSLTVWTAFQYVRWL